MGGEGIVHLNPLSFREELFLFVGKQVFHNVIGFRIAENDLGRFAIAAKTEGAKKRGTITLPLYLRESPCKAGESNSLTFSEE